MNRKRKNKLTNGHGGSWRSEVIQLRAAIFERIRNAQIKAVQTVSISLLSATFSCVLRLWFKCCCCDVVYNDITRDSIACSLTLRHVTITNTSVHNSWRYESIALTNKIAGKRMNIEKIKLYSYRFTLANNFLRWTYFGPTGFIHPWTTLVHATLRVSDIINKCNSWLADVMFDWRHVIVTAVERNNQTRRL